MSTRRQMLELLEQHGLHTKKALGQNFLVDGQAVKDIARAALRGDPPGIVEIGPGPGTLTAALAEAGVPVVAVEKDRTLVPVLRELFADQPHVQIVEGDAGEVRFASLLPGIARPAVAGNIPYNITSPLLIALVRQRAELGRVTLMIQREVADRLLAQPGSKTYGSLSVLLQNCAELERVRHVSPTCFIPRPKVVSTVIQLRWREVLRVPDVDERDLERVVRAAFAQRRKMLRNSLESAFESGAVADAGEAAGIDLTRRAETLSVEELGRLAAALTSRSAPSPGP